MAIEGILAEWQQKVSDTNKNYPPGSRVLVRVSPEHFSAVMAEVGCPSWLQARAEEIVDRVPTHMLFSTGELDSLITYAREQQTAREKDSGSADVHGRRKKNVDDQADG